MIQLEDIIIDPEFRDLLPQVDGNDLSEKIEAEGWTEEPIVVWQHHNVLVDGHRRLAIWNDQKKRGVDVGEPQVKERAFKSKSEALIWMSIHQESRRNLSESQRAMLATKLVPHYAEMAKERQKAAGEHGKEGGRGNKKPLSPTGDKGSSKRASEEAAVAVGVGPRTVQKAQAVRKHGSDEMIKAVETGEVSVNRAAKIVMTVPKEDQLKSVKNKPGEENPTNRNDEPKRFSINTDRDKTIANANYKRLSTVLGQVDAIPVAVKNINVDAAIAVFEAGDIEAWSEGVKRITSSLRSLVRHMKEESKRVKS